MTAHLPSGNASDVPLRVREFFLARQPILDRAQTLVAYELLFRAAPTGPASFSSDLSATATVIAHAAQLGLEKVVGQSLGYLNVDGDVLMSDIFQFLPRDRMVLEIIETTRATPEILARIEGLRQDGFRFALDDVIADTEDIQRLLPHADIVKLDLRDMPVSALLKLATQFKQAGKKLLAEKVETREQFELCLQLGVDYFQGYYFARPVVLSGKKLSPSRLAIMDLMSLIGRDADNREIEAAIKSDVSLCFNLLRLVNTPAAGTGRRIESVTQALLVLGRSQLQRWLQIMLYAEPSRQAHGLSPLLAMAATRGKLLELIASKDGDRGNGDIAFTVGIMSLMDTLFGMPMHEILEQVCVVDAVSNALLHRGGRFGEMLRLVEGLERVEEAGDALDELIIRFSLSSDDLNALQLCAFEWSDAVTRHV